MLLIIGKFRFFVLFGFFLVVSMLDKGNGLLVGIKFFGIKYLNNIGLWVFVKIFVIFKCKFFNFNGFDKLLLLI